MTPGWRFVVFLSVVLGVWLAENVYVGWRLASLPWFAEGGPRKVLFVSLVFFASSYLLGRWLDHLGAHTGGLVFEFVGAVWMGVLMLLVCALLVVDVVTVGGLIFRNIVPAARAAAVGLSLLAAVVAVWDGARVPRVAHEKVAIPGLTGRAAGFRIVHLSDLHLGTMFGRRRLRVVLNRVASLNADAVVITGDLIDADPGSVSRYLPQLETLRAPAGVFAVLGNHEYYAGRNESRSLITKAGIRVLDNDAVEVAPGLWIAGVPDSRGGRQTGEDEYDLGRAVAGISPDDAIVLLQHAPEMEDAAAAVGVGLLLNGHTHGGQIWPFGYLVKLAYPRVAGRFQTASMTQIVSRGTGFWGPPMRLFARAEIIVVELVMTD